MSFRYPQPSNEDDFELFCLRFLREAWHCPTLQQYGKRGERQHGIDLIDEGGGPPLRAVQCKHHEPDKTIPPAEIEAEVTKALAAPLPVDEYYILTAARKTAHGQNAVIRINRDHQAASRFKVFVWTWADIEERLSQMDDVTQDRVLRGDSGRSGPAVCQMLAGVVSEHFDRPLYASASVLDGELESAKGMIDRHELEAAAYRLKEIETRAPDKLQPHHWYQLKALRSKIHSDRWEWDKAGRELLDAKRFMPDTERARINEALGYELTRDREKAHALATVLRTEFPHSVRLLTIWARTAPPDTPFAAVAEAASPFVKDDEELNLALAHRALTQDRFEEALTFGRRATELDADSPHAWFILGQAKHALGYRPSSGPQKAMLSEAEEHYGRAVRLARDQKMPGLEAAVRLNRGKVRHVLGGRHADADFAAAAELARPEHGVRTEYASYLLEMDRYEDALRELEADTSLPTPARLFYEAAARYGRNAAGDRSRATELLHDVIAAEPGERWADAHVFLVQGAIEAKTQTAARAVISGSKLQEVDPLVYHTLYGWLEESEGKRDEAKTEYGAALAHLTDQTGHAHVFLLAQALAAVGDDEQALPLFLRSYRPGVFNLECRRLLGCAQQLSRHDVLARVCRELRESGETDPRLIQTELHTLQLYDPQAALRVAREYLATHPDDRHVALWQSHLALRLDHPDLVISDLARLPTVDELTPQGTGMVLNVLNETGKQGAALRYAYDALRAHFDTEFAHGQFVYTFLRLSDHCPELRIGGTAGPGMAVSYREEHDESDRWVVIEDGPDPELARGELGPDHAVSRALMGRLVNASVIITDGGIQPRTATIREVMHKYIYRFRDCLNQFQVRFPGASAIQMFRAGGGDEFDLSPMIRSLEDRRRHVQELDEQYRTRPLPLRTFAELAGRDEFETWEYLAANPGLGIRCFNGQTEGLREGLDLFRKSKTVVVDLVALYTLAKLELLSVLRSPSRPFVVSQTTFDQLQHMAEQADEERRSEGSVTLAGDGKLAYVPVPQESRERRVAFLNSLRDAVRASCRVLPCPQAAELDPKRRNDLVQVVWRHNLDSMLLAVAPDTTLWSDDLVIGLIGQAEFRASRVWTQVVLFVLQQEGAITQREYDRAVARLVGWHYHGVLWNAETVLAAAEIADWQMDRWPVPPVMRCFGNVEANPIERLRIAGEVIRAVWRRDLLSHQRQGFLFAVLTGLGSIRLVQRLGQAVPRLFALDFFAADEVRACIWYWLNSLPGPMRP